MEQRINRIVKALVNNRLGKPLLFFEEIGSTNDVLKERATAGAPEGCLVVAGRQTRGRGRLGKKWLSLPSQGVYLSVLLKPRWSALEAAFINMLATVAVARALERFGLENVMLKWPNDILARGRKIAGVLVESRVSGSQIDFVALGIGVNVRHQPGDLAEFEHATSCRMEGVDVECDDVLVRVLNELDACYHLMQCGDRNGVMREWAERHGAGKK